MKMTVKRDFVMLQVLHELWDFAMGGGGASVSYRHISSYIISSAVVTKFEVLVLMISNEPQLLLNVLLELLSKNIM